MEEDSGFESTACLGKSGSRPDSGADFAEWL